MAAKIVDSCTDFNDFLSWGASRRAETFFDDSYTVFNDFSLARQGAEAGLEGLRKASRAVEKKRTSGKMLKLSTVSHKITLFVCFGNLFLLKCAKTIVKHS